jgi:hypothetical protein
MVFAETVPACIGVGGPTTTDKFIREVEQPLRII